MNIEQNIRDTIKRRMLVQGVTQRELGRRMNVSEARVSRMLNEPGNMRLSTLIRIASALGCRIEIRMK